MSVRTAAQVANTSNKALTMPISPRIIESSRVLRGYDPCCRSASPAEATFSFQAHLE